LIIWMGMNQIAPKPMQPASSATAPGTSSMRKLSRAASSGSTAKRARSRSSSTVPSSSPPKKISPRKRLIICSPWLTAIANIRKGVSMFIGSMPKPIRRSAPSIHTTDTSADSTVSEASLTDDEYRNSSSQVKAMVMAKNFTTDAAPSLMSPTILAKPMTWTVMLSFSYFCRIASSCLAIFW
jgi:hypothetical protein